MNFKKTIVMMALSFGMVIVVMAGNVWNITVESDSDQIQTVSREFARGESWEINALVTDDGIPRVWPTNTTFLFFWQTPSMKTNWYVSTNVNFPVYDNVTITNTMPFVTTFITNSTWYYFTPTNIVVGSVTNVGINTNSVIQSFTNIYTTYITSYTVTNIVDTGRVSAVWNATMDNGSSSYNWWIGGFSNSNPTYRVNGTITLRGAPGYGGTFTPGYWFYPWATTGYVTSIFNTELWLSASTNNPGYFYLMAPN